MFRLLRFYKEDKNYLLNITFILVLFWSIAYTCFEYFLPIKLKEIGYNFATIGILLALTSIFSIFTDFWLGYLQNKEKKKVLFRISFVLLIIGCSLFVFGLKSIVLISVALIIYGIGFDLFDITAYTSIYNNSIEKNRSTNISLRDVFSKIGLIIGAILAGFLLVESPSFIIYFILLFLIIGFTISSNYNVQIDTKKIKISQKKLINSFVADIKKIGFSKLLFSLILITSISFWDALFFGFEPLFIQNFSNPYINELILGGLLLVAYVLPTITLEYYFGKLEDRNGRKNFILIGLFIASIFIFLLSQVKNIFLLFPIISLTSIGFFCILNPAVNGYFEKYSIQLLGRKKEGESAGLMEFFMNIGYIMGPIIGGILIQLFDFYLTFQTLSFFFFVLFILSLFIIKMV